MNFQRATLETCDNATGMVVVIDVLRAFSTAAYAFASGVQRIILVSDVEEAFLLKKQFPSALLMGEVNGYPVNGFDYGNSPSVLVNQDLVGCQFIQRTSAGTQGIVRSIHASTLLASSFCCARATARFISRSPDGHVTFVITGKGPHGRGNEDDACADYIESMVNGESPPVEPYIQRVKESLAAQKFLDKNEPDFPASDLEYCVAVDKFNFVMQVEREKGLLVMKSMTV